MAQEAAAAATPPPLTTTTTTTTTSTSPAPASGGAFQFPKYYHFPPMFTLQPNLNTRRAQLDKWAALVLAYCRHYRIFRLVVGGGAEADATATDGPVRVVSGHAAAAAAAAADDGDSLDGGGAPSVPWYAPDLFRNRHIDRAMPPAEVREVLEDMRRRGRVEFVQKRGAGGGDGAAGSDGAAAADTVTVYVFWKTPEEWAAAVEAFVEETAQRGSVLTLYELTAGDATRGTELHGLDPAVLQRALAVLVKRGKAQVFGAEESQGVKFF